jgi:hypothetical protein
LPLKVASISGRSRGKGKRPDLNVRKYRLNWPARASRRGREAVGRGGDRGGAGPGEAEEGEERKVKGSR